MSHLTSRAFHSDQLGPWYEKVAHLTNKEMVLPMNTGAEAVETAIKTARKWAYEVKGIKGNADIICCTGNFHGRTMAAISMSSEKAYQQGFAPLLPGFTLVPYGDVSAIQDAITENTAAVILEPIQGEAGIVIPTEGFYRKCRLYAARKMYCLLQMRFRLVLLVLAACLLVTGKM